ncbi:CCHC-type domain-containing protein [Trichonephila inaurata madagascariensis]|uniref:CCHC-type domain-containing protein n=1 Tax=Trichonephila inaurata madagascariensis TaxID=2747483 RepID=A0A8X6IMA4_9ARAC|nr:CCHC-type domain-containing protein [Trichonephila inaurata madagascariensis]
MEHWIEPEEESDLVTEYMFKLINRLKRCQEVAINKMEEMQVKRKTWYDKNAVKREFKDGDFVPVLATTRANKLAVQWIGPGTILNKISETNYLVEIPGRRETSQIYHINMLKPYYNRPEHVNVIINDETQNSLADQELDIPYLENIYVSYIAIDHFRNMDLLEQINAVQTRSQVKATREERGIDSGDDKKREDEAIIVSSDAEDELLIPALQEFVPELALLRVTRGDLIEAQKNSEGIKSLYEQAASQLQPEQINWQCSGCVLGQFLNKISETNYLVEIPGRRETSQIYHINMLKPYYKRPEHVNVIINDETQNSLADQELEIPYLENIYVSYIAIDHFRNMDLCKFLAQEHSLTRNK